MDPNNIPPQTPSPNPQVPQPGQFDSSQFDFIMNPQKPPKRSLIPGGPKVKMVIVGLGITTVVIILLVAIMGIFSSKDETLESLVKITQQQNEIIRVSDDGIKKVGGTKTKKLATTANITIKSDQNILINYLAKQKRKVKPKELKLLTNKKTDAELATASSNGRYDEVFNQIMIEKLTEYQKSLEKSYNSAGTKGKEVIKKSYDNVTLILQDNSVKTQ